MSRSQRPPLPLAKLSPPRLAEVYARRRLFEMLDGVDRPVTWIAAPAGAGKTTLAASYLRERNHPVLWYQMDEGDGDPGSFFYYMGLAAQRIAPCRKNPLPLLTPEYLGGLEVFTRNYFGALFERLPRGSVLVFDNYQDVPASSILHTLLSLGFEAIPESMAVLVLSRTQLPQEFARMQAARRCARLEWDSLRLLPDEAAALACLFAGNVRLTNEQIAQLHHQCEGWIAGLLLLLEGATAKTGVLGCVSVNEGGAQELFDYFAGEVFARRPPAVQRFLLQTSLFPSFTIDMAERLTGGRAAALLRDLVRNHHFTERRKNSSYHYHPLFRAFLHDQAREILAGEELTRCRHEAAAILVHAGHCEEAASLYLDAEDWDAASILLCEQAPRLASEGRLATLRQTIQRLPPEALDTQPWLRYWLGICFVTMDPGAAIRQFEAAYERFDRNGEADGILLAWAGAADAISFQMIDYSQFAPWLARLDRLMEVFPPFAGSEIDARVTAAVVSALGWYAPTAPSFPEWRLRARDLLPSCKDTRTQVALAFNLFMSVSWYSGGDELAQLGEYLTALVPRLQSFPFEQSLCRHAQAYYYVAQCQDPDLALGVLGAHREAANRTGVHVMTVMIHGMTAWSCLVAGDLAQADAVIEHMEELVQLRGSKLDHCLLRQTQGWRAAMAGDFNAAQVHLGVELLLEEEIRGLPTMTLCLLTSAGFQVAAGEIQLAKETLAKAGKLLQGTPCGPLLGRHRLISAGLAFLSEREQFGVELLREGLELVRKTGFLVVVSLPPGVLAQLCMRALQEGIEVETVQNVIRKTRLTPPEDLACAEYWPWPVRIHALGRFTVEVNGAPLAFAHKEQRRPLALLKALLALGGREIAVDQLAEMLWPDVEGDAAHRSLITTVHRLRRLLGVEQALITHEGRLSLSRQHCWTDVWVLEQQLGAAETALKQGAGKDGPAGNRLQPLLALYLGPFLGGEACDGWALGLRERLHSRMLRVIERVGAQHEQGGAWEEAADSYRKGIELDPLAELFYRRLMGACRALGRSAEALSTFERCRASLQMTFGIIPSPETLSLHQAILTEARRPA